MDRNELILKAVRHLRSKGYIVFSPSPSRYIDFIAFGEDKNKPIFVTVGDASKVKSIPMNGFGCSKRAKERAKRFVDACNRWVETYCLAKRFEYDAVWVGEDGCYHMVGIRPVY